MVPDRPRTPARWVVDAVADRRTRKGKSWKGPSPPATSTPIMSLGDIWVTDARSAGERGRKLRLFS